MICSNRVTNTFLRNFHYLHRIINERKIRVMSIDMKTRAHYELNFRRGHIDQILEVKKKIINSSGSLTTEIYTNLERYGGSLPIKLPSCAHRPNFRNSWERWTNFSV